MRAAPLPPPPRGFTPPPPPRRAPPPPTTGYVVGGISPLGQRKRLPTTGDESALGWETVLVSAGRRGLQIELRPQDLVELTGATVAPIAAG